MPFPPSSHALWTWCVADRVGAASLRAALSDVLQRPVVPLGVVEPDSVMCDVWHTSGDFPTVVECYLAPVELGELAVVATLARRLGRACLLPDDTLNPTRYLLAAPAGTLSPVHVDVTETDDGDSWSNVRPCTVADPWCRQWRDSGRSRWAPGSVVPVSA